MPSLEEPSQEEDVPLHTEVRAETGDGFTRSATNDPNLYQRFLELPVPVVLLTLWLVGVALIGLCALPLYQLFWALLETLAGA
jgi:hypothetical protein